MENVQMGNVVVFIYLFKNKDEFYLLRLILKNKECVPCKQEPPLSSFELVFHPFQPHKVKI